MAPSIRAIDTTSVHRICSGQVILDLSTAVKELLENALDAGATAIEVKLKESGAELIEVADNGSGVSPADYEALTLKYHTSKISKFTDLQGLSSYGFRGEALSSLCTVADISVVTRTAEEPAGTRLEFDDRGRLTGRATVPRAVGTTVAVRNLFARLPVRHRELKASLRREFSKLTHCLQAYALVARGVRLIATHQQGSGPRGTIVATQGSQDVWSDVIAVFGPRAAAGLQAFTADLSGDPGRAGAGVADEREGEDAAQGARGPGVTGYVSRPGMGGRAQGDRQFFSLNGRPVDLPRFAKALNEAFRVLSSQAGADARPSAVLDLALPTDAYDINLAPNKRQVALHGENALLARFKEALQALWEPSRHTFAVNGAGKSTPGPGGGLPFVKRQRLVSPPSSQGDEEGAEEGDECGSDDEGGDESGGNKDERPDHPGPTPRTMAFDAAGPAPGLSSFAMPGSRAGGSARSRAGSDARARTGDDPRDAPGPKGTVPLAAFGFLPSAAPTAAGHGGTTRTVHGPASVRDNAARKRSAEATGEAAMLRETPSKSPASDGEARSESPGLEEAEVVYDIAQRPTPSGERMADISQPAQELDLAEPPEPDAAGHKTDLSLTPPGEDEAVVLDEAEGKEGKADGELEAEDTVRTPTPPVGRQAGPLKMHVDLESLRRRSEEARRRSRTGDGAGEGARFRAATLQRCAAADRELERVFDKADFARMHILGQFNLGFIIARLGKDLFIIDQHASDEKANFERLEASLKLNCQPLLQPRRLELAPLEELHVRENLEVFKANGFDFVDDAQGHLALSAVPFSKGVVFGETDVQELIGLVEAGLHSGTPASAPGNLLRPSRVRAILASRACRSSIMIGKHLSQSTMQRVVITLASLKSPWNCPHGRPTMRHLWLLPE